ncbi:hypothetical protein [Pseudomonas vanderleydeniana]|uniref:Uncharacterized protein n=1 Tax=Pseudomonas vanderleydeniana TaxID=2745495 RepID=A0A9E6PIL5_9PSED|nr:hypothetical protein [Pseudomonas vanderleydeniana]QXI27110.1 hypothetical protein HU752_024815 [Pseudomonas vanderleydeniana]
MNSISPVLPVVEILPGEEIEGWRQGEPNTHIPEEGSLPDGVALLLAVLEPSLRGERRPLASPMAAAGRSAVLGAIAQAPGAAEALLLPEGAMPGGEGLPAAGRGTLGVEAVFRDGLGMQAQAAVEEPAPSVVEEGRGSAETVPEVSVLRGAGEFTLDFVQARLEAAAALAPPFFSGMAEESAAMPEPHEEATPEPSEPDEEPAASGDLLQVPFNNDRARGQVLISREGPGAAGLLIRATDRQVFEQLKGHLDQARQPHWRLDEMLASDSGRST